MPVVATSGVVEDAGPVGEDCVAELRHRGVARGVQSVVPGFRQHDVISLRLGVSRYLTSQLLVNVTERSRVTESTNVWIL